MNLPNPDSATSTDEKLLIQLIHAVHDAPPADIRLNITEHSPAGPFIVVSTTMNGTPALFVYYRPETQAFSRVDFRVGDMSAVLTWIARLTDAPQAQRATAPTQQNDDRLQRVAEAYIRVTWNDGSDPNTRFAELMGAKARIEARTFLAMLDAALGR